LILTIAVGVNKATLAFGGAGASGDAANSGVVAELTGLLGKFDVTVNVKDAFTALTAHDFTALLAAFDVPGKFSIHADSAKRGIADVFMVTATGIEVTYDPAYKDSHPGQSQTILTIATGQISLPKFGTGGA